MSAPANGTGHTTMHLQQNDDAIRRHHLHAPATVPVVVLLAMLSLFASIAAAQVSTRDSSVAPDSSASHWLSGLTLSLPSENGQTSGEYVGIGYAGVMARPNRIGPDLSFVVFPRFIAWGALIGGARANVALPIALGRGALLIPSGGLSAIVSAGLGGAGFTPGANGTLSLLFFERAASTEKSAYGFRIAVSLHRFSGDDVPMLRVIELGLVKR
jgi:hypothetical protein